MATRPIAFQRFLQPLLAAAALLATVAASAQVTPIVVSLKAIGATDGYVHTITDQMTKHGIQTTVDNSLGALGMILAGTVARAKPDKWEPLVTGLGLSEKL